ncbi:MAG: PIN domain-containing protein [Lachnospiraceae bacterium]
MAAFLVDYENVFAHVGLKGVEFLNSSDSLTIFYSKTCQNIRKDEMEAILQSGCEFKTYKLVQTHKNGLDFYIAAEAGAVAENGETQIAIISNDKGFHAALDFLKMKYGVKGLCVSKAPSIETAITTLNASNDAVRRAQLHNRMSTLDLGQEYARYEERNAFKARIKAVLAGTDYEERTSEIIQYMSDHKSAPRRELYTGSLHSFGRIDGMAIYRILKDVV